MDKESRKVQKMGLSTLGVSLPKEWAEDLGIKPGSPLSLSREDDGSIRIDVPGRKPPQDSACKIRADECKEPRILERAIIGNYLLGRDSIEITSRSAISKEFMGEIYEAVDRLTGVAIVDQSERSVMLESFVEPTRFPVRGLLRRLQYLAERMVRVSFTCVTQPDEEAVSNVKRLEEEVDRLYWLITRQLMLAAQDKFAGSQIGETDPRHIAEDMLVAAMLERVADVALDLVGHGREVHLELSGFPQNVSKRFLALGAGVQDLARDTMEAFFRGDVASASHVLEVVQELEGECQTLSMSIPMGGDIDTLYCTLCLQLKNALNSLAHIADYYGTIAHVALDRALEGESPVSELRGSSP